MMSTPQGYQGLLMTNLDVYPDDTTSIMASVLKEEINPDPTIVLVRVREEMARMARVAVFEPLGIERRFAMITRAEEAEKRKIKTLSQAAKATKQEGFWTLAQLPEFQARQDGYSALVGAYSLPQEAPAQTLGHDEAFKALDGGAVNLIAGYITDGQLEDPRYVALEDDQNVFLKGAVCLLVRHGSMDKFNRLKEAMSQLSSRIRTEQMRHLNYLVAVKRQPLEYVASRFLDELKL
jgi:glycine betaine/choline ABC-type transport system substrate-binding protein